ncbi:MAG: cytochrome c biogenesis protein DipZ, partial [Acidimicrobiales bacterium]
TLPHLEAWYANYKAEGLVVIGVHTPEFSFEHVVSNVVAQAGRLGVHYPVAIDNAYGTWDAYGNQGWPSEYLIDQDGQVRYTSFGEGDYQGMEQAIRGLLTAGGAKALPGATDVPDLTPTEATTPESYLGYARIANYVGSPLVDNRPDRYSFASRLAANQLSFGGTWTDNAQSALAGSGAAIRLNFSAREVYLVLGGSGSVTVSVDGKLTKTVPVSGVPHLYTLVVAPTGPPESGILTLGVSSGVRAYDFTFG